MSRSHLDPQELFEDFKSTHAGLDSAMSLMAAFPPEADGESRFLVSFSSELSESDARTVYRTAASLHEKSQLLWANLRDTLSPYCSKPLFGGVPSEVARSFFEHQESLPSYDQLFGTLDYLECDSHRSIFGPAAYFVDLLRFVRINIEGSPNNTIAPENKLLTRRPDLECITLDKTNTSELIPYIDLSNELLESFLRQGDKDAYAVVRESVYPHSLPFDRSLAEIRAYLAELSSGLPGILELLGRSSPSLVLAERLGLSRQELELISTPRAQPDRLAPRIGRTPPVELPSDMPVPDFLVATGLSRTRLNDLVLGRLNLHELNAGLGADLFVNNVDDGLGPMSIEAVRVLDPTTGREVAKETLRNLSPAKLDRVLRFTRLASALGWSFADLDRVLRSLSAPSVPEASLLFDGVGDHLKAEVVTPVGSAFVTRKAFTLELWVRPEDASNGPLFSVESRGVSTSEYPLLVHTVLRTNGRNALTLSIREATANAPEELDKALLGRGFEVVGEIPLPVGEFSHVAVTVSDHGASLFVNGLADRSEEVPPHLRPAFLSETLRETIEVGRARQGGYFCGVIKDLLVWDRALDRDTIGAARYSRWSGREAGIWAYWPMVETAPSYGVMHDRGPSGHHLELGGEGVSTQPRWADRDLILLPLPSASEPDALAFDGVSQYLAVDGVVPGIAGSLDTAPPLGALTVEVWARVSDSVGGDARERSLPLASFEESPTSTRVGFAPDSPVNWTFGLLAEASSGRQLSFGDPTGTHFDLMSVDAGPADGQWHHYAVVVEGQGVSFYVDGVLRGEQTSTKALALPSALGELRVGAQFGPGYFHGDIRELRIWRIARTVRELELDLYRPVASSRSGLVGYWPLQRLDAGSGDGAEAEDRAPGGRALIAGGILAQYSPEFVATPATMPTEIAEPGRALSLDGEAEVLIVDNPNNLGLGAHPRWTLEFWHRLRDRPASDEKVILTQGDLEAGMSVTLVPDGLKVQFWNAGPDGEDWSVLEFLGAPPAEGAWQHVAVTYDRFPGRFGEQPEPAAIPSAPAIAVFVDAVAATQIGTRTESGQPSQPHLPCPSPVGQLDLGGFADGRHTWFAGRFRPILDPTDPAAPTDPASHRFGGELSELRLWTVVRDAAQLERDRHRSVPVVPELALYMPLRSLGALDTVSPLADLAGEQHQNRHTARLQAHHIALYRIDSSDPELLAAHTEYDGAGAQQWQDYTYQGEFSFRPDASASGGDPSAIGLVVLSQRAAGHDRYYRLSNDGPDGSWRFVAHPRGALPSNGGTPPTPSPDVIYRFKLRVGHAGSGREVELEAKVWPKTEAEPADFQIRATDDDVDFAVASGTIGAWTPGRDAAGWVLDNLKVEVATSSGRQAMRFDFESSPVPLPPTDWHASRDVQAPPPADGLMESLARDPEELPAVRFRAVDQNVHSFYAPESLQSEVLGWKDYELAGRMRLVDASAGAGVTFLDRSPSGQEGNYSLRTTPERAKFHLVRMPAAVDALTTLDGGVLESQTQPELGTWYEFRVRVRDLGSHTEIQAMVWASGTTPPAAFELRAVDTSSQRLAAGTVGVWSSGAGHPEFEHLRLLEDELLSEDFQGGADGDFPDTWQETVPGESNSGGADHEFAVSREGDASILSSEPSDDRTYARYAPTGDGAPDPSQWTSYAYSGRVRYEQPRFTRLASPPYVGVTVLTQSDGQDSHYSLRVNRNEKFEFARVDDGSGGDELQGTLTTQLSAETDVWYRYRVEVDVRADKTHLRAKVWQDGQVEPAAYSLLAVDDDSDRYRAGTVGVWVSQRTTGDFDDLRVQQVSFLLGGDRDNAWQDVGARDRIAARPALYLARDEGPKPLALAASQDHPVLARPLPDTAASFSRKARAGMNTEPGRHYFAGTPASPVGFEDVTVQAWVRATEDQDHPLVIFQTREQESGQQGRALGLWLNATGNLRLSVGPRPTNTSTEDGESYDFTSTATVPKDRWSHVACVREADRVTLIVDEAIEVHSFSRPAGGSMELSRIDLGSEPTQRFQGQLKALWIQAEADDPARIVARRYSLPDPSQRPSLVGLWCFTAPPAPGRVVSSMASVPFDLVPGGLPGERSPSVVEAPAETRYFREGRSVLTLTSAVEAGIDALVAGGPGPHRRRCVEVWFRAEDLEALDRPQVLYQEGSEELGAIIYLDSGRIYFGTHNAERGNPNGVWISSQRVRSQRWHHAALLLDGRAELRPDTFCALLDGKLIDRGRATDLGTGELRAHVGGSAITVRFHSGPGKASAGHAFVGQIAEVRVWSSKRSPSEIVQDAQIDPDSVRGGALRASTGLRLWLDFDRARSGRLVDLSSGAQEIAVEPEMIGPMGVGIEGLRVPGAGAALDQRDLTEIAAVREVQSDSGFGFARLTSLWHELPHTGRGSGESFYDQSFNDLRVSDAVWSYAFDTPQLWTIDGSAEADVEVADRLSASLAVPKTSLAGLVAIAEGTKRDRVFVDRALLMVLYREVHLARLLKVSVQEVQELKRLVPGAQAGGAQAVLDLYAAQARLTKAAVKVPEAKLLHDTSAALLADPSLHVVVEAQLDAAATAVAEAVGSIDAASLASPELSQKAAAAVASDLQSAGLLEPVQLQNGPVGASTGLVASTYSASSDLSFLLPTLASTDAWSDDLAPLTGEFNRVKAGLWESFYPWLQDQHLLSADAVATLSQSVTDLRSPMAEQIATIATSVAEEVVPRLTDKTLEFLRTRVRLQDAIVGSGGTLHTVLGQAASAQSEAILNAFAQNLGFARETVDPMFGFLGRTPVKLVEDLAVAPGQSRPMDLQQLVIQLSKVELLRTRFELSSEATQALLERPAAFGIADGLALTLVDLATLDGFRRLAAKLNIEQAALLAWLEQAPSPSEEAVALLAGWPVDEVRAVIAQLGTSAVPSIPLLETLHGVFELSKTTGAEVSALIELVLAFTQPSPTQADPLALHATRLRQVLRATRSDKEFEAAIGKLDPAISVQRRDAMLAAARVSLQRELPQLDTSEAPDLLSSYFLLDPEFSEKVQTSRVVQAISSLQRYIHRCLLDLEPGVAPETIPQAEWEWRKNYRVWEANRKVFLYPENYIEPELRDTKTPEFEALENELLQQEATDASAGKALGNYLRSLAGLGKLKIVGSYLRTSSEERGRGSGPALATDEEVLYLIGRTQVAPYDFYARERRTTQFGTTWTPWKKIELAIHGDFVAPVYAFGRLQLFWTEFTELTRSEDLAVPAAVRQGFALWYLRVWAVWIAAGVKINNPEVLRAGQALKRELSDEDYEHLKKGDWQIDAHGYFYNTKIESRVQRNVTYYQVVVKSCHQDPNGAWSPPAVFSELGSDLTEAQMRMAKWKKPYAQRLLGFDLGDNDDAKAPIEPNTRVLLLRDTSQNADPDAAVVFTGPSTTGASDGSFTISMWLYFDPSLPGSHEPKAPEAFQRSMPVFSYDGGSISFVAQNLVEETPNRKDNLEKISDALSHLRPLANGGFDVQTSLDHANDGMRAQLGLVFLGTEDKKKLYDAKLLALSLAAENADTTLDDLEGAASNFVDELKGQDDENEATPKYRSQNVDLLCFSDGRQSVSGDTPKATIPIGQWSHVAYRFEPRGSDYLVTATVASEPQQDPTKATTAGEATSVGPVVTTTGEITLPQAPRPLREIELGGAVPSVSTLQSGSNAPQYGVQAAELRWWAGPETQEDLALGEPSVRIADHPTLYRLRLDEAPRFGGAVAVPVPSLVFELPPPLKLQVPDRVAARERILLFYGERIASMRSTLQDQGFSIKSALSGSSSGQTRFLDVGMTAVGSSRLASSSVLRIGRPTEIGFRDFVTGESDAVDAPIALSANDVPAKDAILSGLVTHESGVEDVGNQPGWFLVDAGDEHYLARLLPPAPDRDTAPTAFAGIPTMTSRLDVNYETLSSTPSNELQALSLSRKDIENDPLVAKTNPSPRLQFERLSSLGVDQLLEGLHRGGVDALLRTESQSATEIDFGAEYSPNLNRVELSPDPGPASLDFGGSFGSYFEEVFLHVPFLVANRLNSEQKYADAQRWYHFIFDPTAGRVSPGAAAPGDAAGYWRYRPFREHSLSKLIDELTDSHALATYRKDPFDPHAIATLRPSAYQKAIVMKYIDNLLDWGDSLFQSDTREAINEALQLYLLAQDILGPRPQGTLVREDKPVGEVHDFLVADADVRTILETARADSGGADSVFMSSIEALVAAGAANGASRPILSHLLTSFCVPENAEFVGYWSRVDDRLFKIRNSRNFAGVFRQLALFQPPISPSALVAAVGQGGSVSSAVSQLSFPVPHYRYDDVLGRAKDFTEMVMDFGSKLFDAIRDRDEERLTLLQASHEKSILTLTRDAIGYEISAARSAKRELEATQTTVADRKAHFDGLVSGGLSALEGLELGLRVAAIGTSGVKGVLETVAAATATVPQVTAGASGFGGTPRLTLEVGGEQAASAVETSARVLGVVTDVLDRSSDIISTGAGYHRRAEEWKLEQSQATLDLEEIEAQIATADIDIAAAEHALVVHNRTEQHASEVESFHRSKFANESLFNWMISRLTTLYFQAYRVAYDTAKAAERALQYELPTTKTFIEPNNFDSGRRGLLAGEALSLQLAQLEKHQLDNDSRFQEIERTISLKEIDEEALLTLQYAGACDFALPQALFDEDFPGHYFRVIKTLELTLETSATVTAHRGPNATLMQLGHRTLLEPDMEGVLYLRGEDVARPSSTVLRSDWRANQQIAVSKANQRDHGMFVLDFFKDDRYFPFEGTGVVSNWRLEVPVENGAVPVSDVLIHLRYTAAVDPGGFKADVKALGPAPASS